MRPRSMPRRTAVQTNYVTDVLAGLPDRFASQDPTDLLWEAAPIDRLADEAIKARAPRFHFILRHDVGCDRHHLRLRQRGRRTDPLQHPVAVLPRDLDVQQNEIDPQLRLVAQQFEQLPSRGPPVTVADMQIFV